MIRLAVRCPQAVAELVLAELVQLAPNGVEEERGPDWVEYAIYGAEGELPDLGAVGAELGGEPLEVRSEVVPDDWADRWRDFHQPTHIAGGRVVIRPSWHETESGLAGADRPNALDVVIDPGQAFGTGAHPTTRMCVELLLELADGGDADGSLVDLGTGSAVLAIVAAKLGFDPVLAVDNEAAAVEAARENARANDVRIAVERLNLREVPPPPAQTVVANLTAPLLRDVAASLTKLPRRLVCSGLLAREAPEVAAALEAAGLRVLERRDSGDWSALLLAGPA
jgi:ribosomal protein L11 methyltransferase